MRIKVVINVEKPLRRGYKLVIIASSMKRVDKKYERLGDFCYFYEKWGHVDRECNEILKNMMKQKKCCISMVHG
ncbi:Gag polyprotein [Bienertia sinuspersici]